MTSKYTKIAVIGDKDSAPAFRAIGADAFVVSVSEAEGVLKKLADSDYGVIFITEELAAAISEPLQIIRVRSGAAVTVIPSAANVFTGIAEELLKKDIERAIGTDAVFGK